MRTLVVLFLALVLSLWLGGLAALIIFVSSLFKFQRSLGVEAAPQLFHVFERYQIVLSVLASLLLVVWHVMGRSFLKIIAIGLVAIGTAMSVVQIAWITPTINASRTVDTAKFERFHHLASTNYSSITIAVLVAGIFVIFAARREWIRRGANEIATVVVPA